MSKIIILAAVMGLLGGSGCGDDVASGVDVDLGGAAGDGPSGDMTSCPDICTLGAKRCVVAASEDVCQVGVDGCPAWATSACGTGTLCLKESCEVALPCFCPTGFTCNAQSVCVGGDSQSLANDATTYTVSGTVTSEGAAPAVAAMCATFPMATQARLTFKDTVRGASFGVQVPCSAATYAWTTKLFPGTYDVSVVGDVAYGTLPKVDVLAKTGLVVAADQADVVIDVRRYTVSGNVTIAGAAPTTTAACAGAPDAAKATVTLRQLDVFGAPDVVVPIKCSSADFAWSAKVGPGKYIVTLVGDPTYSNVPSAQFRFKSALVVTADVPNQNIDLKRFNVSGTITLDGTLPAAAAACSGAPTTKQAMVRFIDIVGGSGLDIPIPCSATNLAWNGTLFAGTYHVYVVGEATYSTLPNAQVSVMPALVVDKDLPNQVLDVKRITISGSITVNGAPPSTTAACATAPTEPKAYVQFVDNDNAYFFAFLIPCSATDFTWTAPIYPGHYDIQVYGNSAYTDLPHNGVNLTGMTLTASKTGMIVDVPSVMSTTTITLNGAVPTDKGAAACAMYPGEPKAEMWLNDPVTHGSARMILKCSQTGYSWTGSVPAGHYLARVQGHKQFSNLPEQFFTPMNLVQFGTTPGMQTIDVKTSKVGGKITLNGAQPTTDPSCMAMPTQPKAYVTLTDVDHDYVDFEFEVPCSSADFSWSGDIYPGKYSLSVRGVPAKTNLPSSSFLVSPRITLP